MHILDNFRIPVKQVGLVVVLAGLMMSASLVLLNFSVWAGHIGSGAGGCGTLAEALGAAEDGDIIARMLTPTDQGGVTITKNIVLQGGWLPDFGQGGGCDEASQFFTDTQDLIDTNFIFVAPQTRSLLTHDAGPVITIDPAVISLTIQHMAFENQGFITTQGGGISGVISNGAQIRLENILVTNSHVISAGGGLYLEVRGGSRLVISDSQFVANKAEGTGGGFEIHVYDDSEVLIYNTQVSSNTANGSYGGGGRIVIETGQVKIVNSVFRDNQAPNGQGGGLSIERVAERITERGGISNGSAYVWLINTLFENNSALNDDNRYESEAVTVFDAHLFLPLVLKRHQLSAIINSITLNGGTYSVAFQTSGFEPALPGRHVHFFFDTVPPEEAGVPGSGPWKVYGGPSPFTGYTVSDRPSGATRMCVLVANQNHSIQLGTGNCYPLP